MAKKLLSISLLVSGREDTTEKCLDSLKKLQDELDTELILVDTGCKKGFRKKLETYAAKIVDFPWCNDFAQARNAGLSLATGDWFLFLDDDEWFEDVTPIIDFFSSGEYQAYEQAVYKARNYSKLDGSAYTDEWVSRMIHLEEDTHFEGAVHESLVPARGKCKRIDAFVHHYGYAFATEEEKLAHKERNVKILKDLMEKEPDNMRWRLQIVQEYADVSSAQDMVTEARDAIKYMEHVDQPFINRCRGAFYTAVLIADLWLNEYEECLRDAECFLRDSRNHEETLCGLYKYQVEALRQVTSRMTEKEGKLPAWNSRIADGCRQFLDHYEAASKQVLEEQERIIAESILFVKDVMTDAEYRAMKMKWVCALALSDRKEEIPAEYVEELTEKLRKQMDGDGEFLFLDEAGWTLAKNGVLPLEDLILELPFSQWVVQVLVLKSKKSESAWDEMRLHLMDIQTREDIRYDYFHTQAVNDIIVQYTKGKTYEELSLYLQEFAQCNLRYADWVYTEEAFMGEMEMVEEPCRAAIWIARMFDCDETDWSGRLDCLKKAAKEWPLFGETAKAYAVLIGKEQTRQSEIAQNAASELQMMAGQVKEQVQVLIAEGRTEEALSVIGQLRQLLPQDQELKSLEKQLQK